MSKLAVYLNQHVIGNVFDRPSICSAYASDRSILSATPRLVALPENSDDICKLLRFANQLALRDFSLPVTVRGTGLDKTGAAIGDGLVLSTERLNRIEEIDIRGRLVRVQPGVILEKLNSALALQGLTLPVSCHPRATLGGLIANCTNDDASEHYGGIYHFVERVEIALPSGDLIQLAPYSMHQIEAKRSEDSVEGALYRRIEQLLDQYGDTIIERSMHPFDAAGYANITKVKQNRTLNLLPLMFASQGTLGVITDIILRVEPLSPDVTKMAVTLHDDKSLLRFLNFVRDLDPGMVQIYDLRMIREAAKYGNQPILISHRELDDGWLVLIEFHESRRRASKKIRHASAILPSGAIAIEETPENQAEFQEIQSSLFSFLNDNLSGERLPIADDVYIPSYKFSDFLEGLKLIEETLETELPLYGSFASSNYNVRPILDYTTIVGRKQAISFLRQYSHLVSDLGGSLTGGSPEGRVKALATLQTFSPNEQQLYRDIKEAFDPNNILNPGVKLGAELKQTLRYLHTAVPEGLITP